MTTDQGNYPMREDFAPTQEEADACAYIRSMPFDPNADFEALSKLEVFITAYSRRHGGFPAPSREADVAITLCVLERDYSRIAAILPRQREIVEAMFARAEFDCEVVTD